MIDRPFRSILPRLVRPVIKFYKVLNLSPNQLTIAGFFLALSSSFAVGVGHNYLAITLWWLGRFFDGTDGIYARATNQVSDFGGFLDIFLDMGSYGLMILGFAYYYTQFYLIWPIILFLYILSITGALALGGIERKIGIREKDNRTLALATGLAEGGETGIAYTLFLLFPKHIAVLGQLWIAVLGLSVIGRMFLASQILGTIKRK